MECRRQYNQHNGVLKLRNMRNKRLKAAVLCRYCIKELFSVFCYDDLFLLPILEGVNALLDFSLKMAYPF